MAELLRFIHDNPPLALLLLAGLLLIVAGVPLRGTIPRTTIDFDTSKAPRWWRFAAAGSSICLAGLVFVLDPALVARSSESCSPPTSAIDSEDPRQSAEFELRAQSAFFHWSSVPFLGSGEAHFSLRDQPTLGLWITNHGARPTRKFHPYLQGIDPHAFYQLGIRSISLTHNLRALAADGVGAERTGGGLTESGRQLVREMNELDQTEAAQWPLAITFSRDGGR